jgi:hypothetical protein
MRRFALLPLVWLLAVVAPAFAWGEEGHRVIGWIAYQRLNEEAKDTVDYLLGLEKSNLPDACFWADAVARKQARYRSINPLHYANVQKGAPGYDAQRDRPAGGDIVSAIEKYKAILADKDRPDAERLEALRFLAHFVGDIHQPLHVGHKEDKGGNDLQVRFFDRGTNLHAVWDTGILQRSGRYWEQLARELNGRLTTEDAKKHTEQMQPDAWAQESYRLVVAQVYAGATPGAKLSQSYVDEKLPLVEQQLSVAGLRLAAVLNETLGGSGAVRPVPNATAPTTTPATNSTIVYVTRSGKKYHAEGCRYLTATKSEISLADAKQRYEACKICRPPE